MIGRASAGVCVDGVGRPLKSPLERAEIRSRLLVRPGSEKKAEQGCG